MEKHRNMKRHILPGAMMALCGLILFGGCKKDEMENGNIFVRMTDAPAAYQQVNVDIVKVQVHHVDGSGNGAWIDLPTNAGIYNLLALQNGIDTTIVHTTQLGAGKITQMRLLLGSNNTLMVDSVIHPMKVPSGSQSGIKLVGELNVVPNQTLNVLIDFVADESVVESGNGKYHLKPVVKVVQ
jgi:hypothetical protein